MLISTIDSQYVLIFPLLLTSCCLKFDGHLQHLMHLFGTMETVPIAHYVQQVVLE